MPEPDQAMWFTPKPPASPKPTPPGSPKQSPRSTPQSSVSQASPLVQTLQSKPVEHFDESHLHKVSHAVKNHIMKDLVEPSLVIDVKEMIDNKRNFRITGQAFETISKILLASAGILSFSSGYFNNPILSFVAGSVSTVSLACLQFSSYAFKESKERTKSLNNILRKLNIEPVPATTIEDKGADNGNVMGIGVSGKY